MRWDKGGEVWRGKVGVARGRHALVPPGAAAYALRVLAPLRSVAIVGLGLGLGVEEGREEGGAKAPGWLRRQRAEEEEGAEQGLLGGADIIVDLGLPSLW